MKAGFNILAGVMIVIGTIFSLQGAGILQGSSMTGQTQWLAIGIGLMIAGIGLFIFKNRK
jgi:LPXTG-motif cell wall-anchored protein